MIHFIPEPTSQELGGQGPYAEAVSRLASIRQALACVEQFAGETESESMAEAKLAAAWPVASPAHQRVYDARSARTAAAAAAGLEALAALESGNALPHRAAIQRLKRELGSGVDDIDRLFSL
nr:hypothetical protein [uncultured Sphingomonas sp.]